MHDLLAEHEGRIARFVADSGLFLSLRLTDDLVIAECDRQACDRLQLPGLAEGGCLADFCVHRSEAAIRDAMRTASSEPPGQVLAGPFDVQLSSAGSNVVLLRAAVLSLGEGYLLVALRREIAELEALRSMAALNGQLVNLTRELKQKNDELVRSRQEIHTLQGLIPICASCKKVRDDTGFWQSVDQYLHERADVHFTHGICPDCMKRLYPGITPKKG